MASLYETIGRWVEQENARYFNELRNKSGYSDPVLSDLNSLETVIRTFCRINDITLEYLTSKAYDRKAAQLRQICLAVCYKLYTPNALIPELKCEIPRKLNIALAGLLNISHRKIGEKSKKSLFLYGHHRTFKASVDEICNKLTGYLHISA